MPRITEYGNGAPSVDVQAPPLEVSNARMNEAGSMGRAIRQFGNQIEEGMDYQYKRVAQEEVSNAQVDSADMRADSTIKLNEQIRQGTVDVEGLKTEFQEYVDKQSEKYQTDHGRNTFLREAAATRGSLVRSAAVASATLAGEKAKANKLAALDRDSSTIYDNPEMFPGAYESHMQAIDDDVQAGVLPAAMAGRAKHEEGLELAKSAVKGWAQNDPDKAQKLLDSGYFNSFFNGDTKAQLQGYIHTQKSAQEVDSRRQETAEKKAKEKNAEAWKIKNMDRLENNQLSAKEVIRAAQKGVLSYDDAKEQIMMIDRNAREKSKPNSALELQLSSEIFRGDLDSSQMMAKIDSFAAEGKINIATRSRLLKGLDSTPQGQAAKLGRAGLSKFIQKQLIGRDEMSNVSDPSGAQNAAMAYQLAFEEEQRYRDEKKPVADLYDPQNKDNLYDKVLRFKRSSKDVMKARIETMRAQNGAKGAVLNADKTKAAVPRNPGESIQAWLTRQRAAGASQTAPAARDTQSVAPAAPAAEPSIPKEETRSEAQARHQAEYKEKLRVEAAKNSKDEEEKTEKAREKSKNAPRTKPSWPPAEF